MNIKIFCTNTGEYLDVAGGSTLAQIATAIEPGLGFKPICARVNNKTEGMGFAVYMPKTIEFQDRTTGSGPRVYTRSLCMLLYSALQDVLPDTRLRIEHSISHGYYCRLAGYADVPQTLIDDVFARMRELSAADVPFCRHEEPTEEVKKMFDRRGQHSKSELLRTTRELYTVYYSLGDVCDSYYGALAPSTGYIDVFDIIKYKEGFLLMPFDAADPSRPAQYIAQEKMYKAFTDYVKFNHIIGVCDVGGLNTCVMNRKTADLINVAEALHEKALAHISDEITKRYREGGARIVLISGPSSSGKTTTTKRLAIQLMTNLLKPQMISLDDYFINRELTPLDADGEYDYESLYALDLEQFNADLNAILAGEDVQLPSYNFEKGCRQYKGKHIKLDEGSILLIEGIHGLNPELTLSIPEKMKFRLYVSALTTLSIDDHNWVPTTDNRLLRRIIRDFKYRGTSAEDTIKRWPSVRRGEDKWIFPYQENADAMFNSSFVFELGVMKDYAESILRNVHADVPEYAEAYRLRKFLSYFKSISSSLLPSTSLLREFLGGSSFKY
ncbi:MAG: nucleoside kinase [Muribaculaceae bacterium]|jgi:uridine kinase|nr:nucleoside kinase [Muribaculaceae bacterium]